MGIILLIILAFIIGVVVTYRRQKDQDLPKPAPAIAEAEVDFSWVKGIPVSLDKFWYWADAAVRGRSIAVGQWTGKGKMFSRYSEYELLLEYLREINVLDWNSNKERRQGRDFTLTGEYKVGQWLKQTAQPPYPTPDKSDSESYALESNAAYARVQP